MDLLARLAEYLRAYESGELTLEGLFGYMDELLEPGTIDAVMTALPAVYRAKYVVHLERVYGAEGGSAENLMFIWGGTDDRSRAAEHLAWLESVRRRMVEVTLPTVREWLAATEGR